MQYTIRRIPKAVDQALRRQAKLERKSLNELAIEALATRVGVGVEKPKRDLSFMGKMDDETYAAIQSVRAESERIWQDDER